MTVESKESTVKKKVGDTYFWNLSVKTKHKYNNTNEEEKKFFKGEKRKKKSYVGVPKVRLFWFAGVH